MTKSRKVGIVLALALTLVLAFANYIPVSSLFGNSLDVYAATTSSNATNYYDGNYYAGLNEDLTGTAFRTQLADLITRTHTSYTSYDDLADVYKTSDADPNKSGNIIWFYTGTSVSFSKFGGNVGDTNREHVWAKHGGSTIDEKKLAGSDAHHLRPTETNINSIRGEQDFAEVPKTTSNRVQQNKSYDYGNSNDVDSWVYQQGGFFYPAKGFRGATARILFYVQVRWGDHYGLSFVDGAGSTKTIGKISDLLKWHIEEPPTEAEIRRNEVVFGVQHNRNPFIDHPEYAEMIFCNDGKSYNNALKNVVDQCGSYLNSNTTPPESVELSQDNLTLQVGQQSSQITATVLPAEANQNVTWTTSNSSVATVSNGVVTAVGVGSATITVASNVNSNVKATIAVTVNPVPLTGLTMSPSSPITMSPGGTRQLQVTATPSNATYKDVTWSSSDTSVATVTQGGLVTAVSGGTATITATSNYYPSIKASVTITVKIPTSITITGTPDTTLYYAGERFDPTGLTVTVEFNDGTTQSDLPYTDFQWLGTDGTTTSEILQVGMTEIICKFGDVTATVTGITVEATPPEVLAFVEKVEAIAGKTTLQERFAAIKEALVAYNDLATRYQAACADAYATLQQAMASYNAAATAVNNEINNAVTFSGETFGKLIAAVLGLAVIVLIKKG